MIPARHNRWLSGLLHWYVRRLFRRYFSSVDLHGFDGHAAFFANPANYPLIFFSNHQTWWDGFLEIPIITTFGLHPLVMMEEKNLRKYPFFRHTGVFGIDLTSSAGRAQGLRYAVRHLRQADARRRALFIYPHGRLVPFWEEWPPFEPGLETLLRLSGGGHAVPVFKRIVYHERPLPAACLEVGTPVAAAGRPDGATLRQALLDTGDRQATRLAGTLPQPAVS